MALDTKSLKYRYEKFEDAIFREKIQKFGNT